MQDRQVDIQSLLPRLVSLVLRRGTPPPLPHTPNQQDTNPPNTTASRLRAGFSGPARSQSSSCPPPPPPPPCSHPLAPARHHPRPWDLAPGAATAIPLWRGSRPLVLGSRRPASCSRIPGGGRPSPKSPPDDTSCPFQNRFSSSSFSLQGIGRSRRCGSFRTR